MSDSKNIKNRVQDIIDNSSSKVMKVADTVENDVEEEARLWIKANYPVVYKYVEENAPVSFSMVELRQDIEERGPIPTLVDLVKVVTRDTIAMYGPDYPRSSDQTLKGILAPRERRSRRLRR